MVKQIELTEERLRSIDRVKARSIVNVGMESIVGLTVEEKKILVEKLVLERIPESTAEKKGTWCNSERKTITRLRNNIRKQLWNQLKIES